MIVDVDQITAGHLVRAIDEHLRWCRTNAIDPPDELLRLLGHVSMVARNGQQRPTVAPPLVVAHDRDMQLLTLTYEAAARRLGVSARTVRRLVADGALAAVSIAGARRIRTADLGAYVDSLVAS